MQDGGDSTTALVRKCEALKSPWWISGVFTFTDPVMRRLRKVQCVCVSVRVCAAAAAAPQTNHNQSYFFLELTLLHSQFIPSWKQNIEPSREEKGHVNARRKVHVLT